MFKFNNNIILPILISIILILIIFAIIVILIILHKHKNNESELFIPSNLKKSNDIKKENKNVKFDDVVRVNDGTKKNSKVKNNKKNRLNAGFTFFNDNNQNRINHDFGGFGNTFEIAFAGFDNRFTELNHIMNDFNNFLYDDIPIMQFNFGMVTNTPIENKKINVINGEKVKVRTDTQNVHDSLVNNRIRDAYSKISNSNAIYSANKDDDFTEMYNYYLNHDQFSEDEKRKIIDVLEHVKKGDRFSVFDNIFGENVVGSQKDPINREDEILRNVWNRTKSLDIANTRNNEDGSNNADNIKYNLGKAIVETVNGQNLECLTGRVTRYLSALEINDNEIKPTKTKDMLRQEIINRSSVIIQNEIDKCYNDKNCIWHESAKSYKENMETSDEEMKKGKEFLYNKIDELIDEYKKQYSDSVTELKFIDGVKQEILAGIE